MRAPGQMERVRLGVVGHRVRGPAAEEGLEGGPWTGEAAVAAGSDLVGLRPEKGQVWSLQAFPISCGGG